MTDHDTDVKSLLADALPAETPPPTHTLADLTARGRKARRRRTAGRTGGAALAVAALVAVGVGVGVPQALAVRGHPAAPASRPHSSTARAESDRQRATRLTAVLTKQVRGFLPGAKLDARPYGPPFDAAPPLTLMPQQRTWYLAVAVVSTDSRVGALDVAVEPGYSPATGDAADCRHSEYQGGSTVCSLRTVHGRAVTITTTTMPTGAIRVVVHGELADHTGVTVTTTNFDSATAYGRNPPPTVETGRQTVLSLDQSIAIATNADLHAS
ncbi:MAG TPA: hypothetical protein VGN37_00260 [Actinocatenispora sp.]